MSSDGHTTQAATSQSHKGASGEDTCRSRTTCSVRQTSCTPEAGRTPQRDPPKTKWPPLPPPCVCPAPCRAPAGTSAGMARADACAGRPASMRAVGASVSATGQGMWTGPRAPLSRRSVPPPHVAGALHHPRDGGRRRNLFAGWPHPRLVKSSRVARRQAGRRTPWRTHPASVLGPATTPARRGVRRCSVWRGHCVSRPVLGALCAMCSGPLL